MPDNHRLTPDRKHRQKDCKRQKTEISPANRLHHRLHVFSMKYAVDSKRKYSRKKNRVSDCFLFTLHSLLPFVRSSDSPDPALFHNASRQPVVSQQNSKPLPARRRQIHLSQHAALSSASRYRLKPPSQATRPDTRANIPFCPAARYSKTSSPGSESTETGCQAHPAYRQAARRGSKIRPVQSSALYL